MKTLKRIHCVSLSKFIFITKNGEDLEANLYGSSIIDKNDFMKLENEIDLMRLDFTITDLYNYNHFYYTPELDKNNLLEKALKAEGFTIEDIIKEARNIEKSRSLFMEEVSLLRKITGHKNSTCFKIRKQSSTYDEALKTLESLNDNEEE